MSNGFRTLTSAAGAILLAAAASPALAAGDGWEFEVTPYLWAAGIDADVTVRNQSATIDAKFSDIFNAVDLAGALLFRAQHGPWVAFTQIDYLSLDSNNLDNAPAAGRLEQDVFMASGAFGYQFASADGRRSVDVLVGLRHLSMDNTLTLNGLGSFESDRNLNDPIIMIRPSFRLSERWRLNPTFAFGDGGDSKKVWELQPTLQFQATRNGALRIGYRKLHYELANTNSSFDGAFQGVIVGYGGTFGGSR